MKKNLLKACALGLSAILFFGCERDEDEMMLRTSKTQNVYAENCDVIDFDSYRTGFISEVHSAKGMGPVKVMNQARNSDGILLDENRAMIFDLRNPTGDDTDDLFHPERGKALIINQIGTDIPNDNQWGGVMLLDFSAIGPVTINTTTVIDIDEYEDASYIRLYSAGGGLLKEHKLEPIGNASVQIATLNTSGVMKMEVTLAGTKGHVGSGAIDDIEFCIMPKDGGCTKTQGYWKTHGDPKNKKKYNNTWDPYVNEPFFSSGMTYMDVLNEPVKGRAYFILAHQYIAAMLNVDAGASMPADVKVAFDAATNYFQNNSPTKNDALKSQITNWANVLDDYNNGRIGPGHCD